jgi:hypothetical protein
MAAGATRVDSDQFLHMQLQRVGELLQPLDGRALV